MLCALTTPLTGGKPAAPLPLSRSAAALGLVQELRAAAAAVVLLFCGDRVGNGAVARVGATDADTGDGVADDDDDDAVVGVDDAAGVVAGDEDNGEPSGVMPSGSGGDAIASTGLAEPGQLDALYEPLLANGTGGAARDEEPNECGA